MLVEGNKYCHLLIGYAHREFELNWICADLQPQTCLALLVSLLQKSLLDSIAAQGQIASSPASVTASTVKSRSAL
jgi:hypothetical protein